MPAGGVSGGFPAVVPAVRAPGTRCDYGVGVGLGVAVASDAEVHTEPVGWR